MHRALYINELLVNIYSQLYNVIEPDDDNDLIYRSDPQVDLATLASLTRTCRAFHDPATRFLWSAQDSLFPVLRCLDSSVMERDVPVFGGLGKQLIYVHEPSMDQLVRFARYALLIKSMKLTSYERIDSRILDTLFSLTWVPSTGSTQRGVLFPKLQIIHWDCRTAPGDDYLSLFIVPTLTDLSVQCTFAPVMEITLHVLIGFAPYCRLKNFTMGGGHGSKWEYSWAQDIVMFIFQTNYQTLTYIDLATYQGVMSWTWAMLSQIPHLETLKAQIPKEDDEDGEKNTISQRWPHFPSLRSLTLYSQGDDGRTFESFATELMPEVRRPYQLKHLGLELIAPFYDVGANQLIQQMAEICDPMVLDSFSLSVVQYDEVSEDPDIVPTSLAPLLACSYLRHVKLEPMVMTDLDDNAIREMALAWPLLELLDLGWDDGRWVPDSRVTLQGLIPLAEHCPKLTAIWIVVNPSSSEEEVSCREAEMTFSNAVRRIFLNSWTKCDRETAAYYPWFLMKLFPELVSVNWVDDDDSDSGDGGSDSSVDIQEIWGHVNDAIRERRLSKQLE